MTDDYFSKHDLHIHVPAGAIPKDGPSAGVTMFSAVASLLLAGTIKFDGVLSLQLQGDGPVQLMLAQCTSGLGVRGLARHRAGSSPAGGIGDLMGAGNLTVTLETDDGTQRYQGIVPITGAPDAAR